MKTLNVIVLFTLAFLAVHTEGVSQVSTKPKPKIISKPVVTSKSVANTYKKPVEVSRVARIKFDTLAMDLGTVKEDAIIEKRFEFTNTGDKDLIILDVHGSCNCTEPTAPVTPIPPGEKGSILVKYTARNKVGPQKPNVIVSTNGIPSVVRIGMDVWVDQIPGGVK